MLFYLGVPEPAWLGRLDIPLFVSHRRLARRVRLPVASAPWALDSGGFSELQLHGGWRTTPAEYIDACRAYRDGIGQMAWAAPMDWMCEPRMIERTGLSVDRHQALTVENLVELRADAPDVPWIPVLQGWTVADYFTCIDRYAEVGVDVTAEQTVGIGSVCRRQGETEIAVIFRQLAGAGINCHGFGVKTRGLGRSAGYLTSVDSMAWSYDARRTEPLPGCTHLACNNCPRYALAWRAALLRRLETSQGVLL